MDSRPRNNNGQFAPEEMGGVDANTTSAAYNPQIIEARKASLAEKLRRAIGLRRGVEESVPQEQKVLSRFNHGGHGEHGGVKEFASMNISNAQKFVIKRILSGAAEEGKVVGKAATLKGARKSRDLHDLKYGAAAHRIYDASGKSFSAKLRLRELARQAAYDPYAVQAQPAEPGQTGRDFRNAAVGIAALGAGGGVAYAGWRGAQAAKSAQVLTDDALKTSGEARKAARSARVAAARVNRAGKVIKTQLTTFPTFKKVASKIFEEELKNLKELADRSVELNSITYHETNADILRRKAQKL
jgi:hypothetical protein